jgi:hypothetical protein
VFTIFLILLCLALGYAFRGTIGKYFKALVAYVKSKLGL